MRSNYPNGFLDGVNVRGVPVLNTNPGEIFWVNNSGVLPKGGRSGSDANNGDFFNPLATLDAAIGLCTAGRNDIIMIMPGHAETVSTASGITADVSGVSIIGLGHGALRPTFTFSATAATIVVSAANVTIENIITTVSIDNVVSPIVVTGANCYLKYEHKDASSTVEAIRAILTEATADNLTIDLVFTGVTGGNAGVNAVRLVGGNNVRVNVDYYGIASTAVVEFLTTACTNVLVTGSVYNSGTTDGSKLVIDTVGGSTWYADIIDSAAGARFTGGSASALASDDISTITAALYGGAGIATYPSAAVAGNGVSIAEVLRYVQENGVGAQGDAAVQTGGTASAQAYLKGVLDVLSGSTGISTFPSGAAAANNVSIAEVLRYIQDQVINGTGTVLDTNTSLYGVLAGASGIPTFPSGIAAANNVSLAEVIRYIQDQVINGTGTVLPSNTSLYGVLAGATGIPTFPTGAAAANDVSLAEVLRYVQDQIINGTGTVLDTNTSLYGVLAGATGIPTYPTAAAAANSVSIAEVLRYVQDRVAGMALNQNSTNYFSVTADFTSATWNTVAAHEICTVTGAVHLIILPQVAASPTSAGGAATLILGDETTTNSIITSTDAENLTTGEWWVDSTDTRTIAARSNFEKCDIIVANGKDIGYTIGTEALTGGSIIFHCWFEPIDATGAVVAGAGGAL